MASSTLRDHLRRIRDLVLLIPRLDSIITLVNNMRTLWNGANWHLTDDTAAETTPNAVDQTTCQTLINHLKSIYNTHRVSTSFHSASDSTNTLATADMSDVPTGITLMTAAKTAFNAHIILLTSHVDKNDSMKLLHATPTDLRTLMEAVNEWKTNYNLHIALATAFPAVAVNTLDMPV